MKSSIDLSIATLLAMGISYAVARPAINTAGIATSCGQNTCCLPSCHIVWNDSKGCTGDADFIGACSNAFSPADEDHDNGVEICDGAGVFLCTTGGGHNIGYVVNKADEVSAAIFPSKYDECTLSGQCAPCDDQASCGDAVFIGKSSDHSCAAFNKVLDGSGKKLAVCG